MTESQEADQGARRSGRSQTNVDGLPEIITAADDAGKAVPAGAIVGIDLGTTYSAIGFVTNTSIRTTSPAPKPLPGPGIGGTAR